MLKSLLRFFRPPQPVPETRPSQPTRHRRRPARTANNGQVAQLTPCPQVGTGLKPTPTQDVITSPLSLNHRFGSLSVSKPIANALADMGYTNPTPIQQQAIPPFLEGRDVVGQAVTGTGKTAAFGIPLAELIDITSKSVQAIVLVPTRELAVQVSQELSRIGHHRGLRVVAIYGGQPINTQLDALRRGVHVVVGTPGRVMDHLYRSTLNLGQVKFAILDEADKMLDIGFADDMDYILRQTPPFKEGRQTALFSATFPGFIQKLVHRHLNNPVWVRIGGEIETVKEVMQVYYEVAERYKLAGLQEIIDQHVNGGQALVFCRTQIGVDRLVRSLGQRDYPVYGLHGGKTQYERNTVMQAFRAGKLKVLVSTNLASRGIDVPSITHVINYDVPDNVEEYVHRIGRAGRMGREGTAITLVTEWDFGMLDSIKLHMDGRLRQARLSVSP